MPAPPTDRCPRCGATRAAGPDCPRCGVIYDRARPALEAPAPLPVDPGAAALEAVGDARGPLPGREPARWRGEVDDARRELLARAIAPPAALLVAWALVSTGAGHALVRTFVAMWVHELGHAVAAWWSGFGALPGPWRTLVSAERMPLVVIALAAALAVLAWRGFSASRPAWMALSAAGLAAQIVCTLLRPGAARAWITFGGDAGCMVLGAVLVATMWTDPEGPLARGWLRWGFLGLGACALVDALDTWIRARLDRGLLPLGEIEGVGLSDASTLMDVQGWTAGVLTGRYLTLGVACLAALGVGYVAGLVQARARLRAAEAEAGG
jgi:hypothetical protein